MQLAVLLTCHNRKETTLNCLEKLFQQELPRVVALGVYLVDDGSTDGTGDAVKKNYPSVNVIQGDGSLYWNQGMRLAWKTAVEADDWDGYLWLNDDVELYDRALLRMINSFERLKKTIGELLILVGSCHDPLSKKATYGGKDLLHGKLIDEVNTSQSCQTMNGNFVFVPSRVYDLVGNLSNRYQHAYGDYDYGYRAKSMGAEIQTIPGWIGSCAGHGEGTWSDARVELRKRWRVFHSPNGLHPYDFFRYKQSRAGFFVAILYCLNAYRRMIFGLANKP